MTTLVMVSLIVAACSAIGYWPGGRASARRLFSPSTSPRQLPGASPETMAASVAIESERGDERRRLDSITVQFDRGRDIDAAARSDVQTSPGRSRATLAAVADAGAPSAQGEPGGCAGSHHDASIRTPFPDRALIRRHATGAANSQIEGVARVQVFAGRNTPCACAPRHPDRAAAARTTKSRPQSPRRFAPARRSA